METFVVAVALLQAMLVTVINKLVITISLSQLLNLFLLYLGVLVMTEYLYRLPVKYQE
jgi:hypothetical protein